MIERILETGRWLLAQRAAPLKDPASVRRLIDRERARTLRTGVPFSLILFRARRARPSPSTHRLAKLLLTRTRETDEIGWFDDEHVCVLLPHTPGAGASRLAADLDALLPDRAPKPLYAIYTYSPGGFERDTSAGSAETPPNMRDLIGVGADIAAHGKRRERDSDEHGRNGDGGSGHGGNGHGGNGNGHALAHAHSHGHDGKGNGNGGGSVKLDTGAAGSGVQLAPGAPDVATTTSTPPSEPPQPFHATALLPQLLRAAPAVGLARGLNWAEPATVEELLARPLPKWKRLVDVAGASLGLVAAAPLMLIIAAAIKGTSGGPVIFRQHRAGLGGRPFRIYKFRTMVVDAERRKEQLIPHSEQDGPAFKLRSDPRVTGLGKLLRMTSLDELPQLWNVLRGDMSLVGPRPLPMEESDACSAWHRVRLDVTPGITCTWQVRGRSRVSFVEWMRMDMGYIRRRGFWTDVKLLLATVPAVLLRRGAQ